MAEGASNFQFLAGKDDRLFRLAVLAERFFAEDAPTSITKLRSFAELMAKEIAATHAILPAGKPSFDEILSQLRRRSILPQQVSDIFHLIRRAGNAAVHDDSGTAAEALAALKLSRNLAVWFHQVYNNQPNFRVGPFVPPTAPRDISKELRAELESLRTEVAVSRDAEAAARMVAADAERDRLEALDRVGKSEEERDFWEKYASETEAHSKAAEHELERIQQAAQAVTPSQLDLLTAAGAAAAGKIELDERSTRVLIDEQLRTAGWEVDSIKMRYAKAHDRNTGAKWRLRNGPQKAAQPTTRYLSTVVALVWLAWEHAIPVSLSLPLAGQGSAFRIREREVDGEPVQERRLVELEFTISAMAARRYWGGVRCIRTITPRIAFASGSRAPSIWRCVRRG